MFKKLQYLFGLVVLGICLPTQGFFDERPDEKHSQNIKTILKEVGNAVAVELGSISKQIPNKDNGDIDLDQVERLIKQELPVIKTKIAHVVTHDLTKEQGSLVINLLENCKVLSETTVNDLMLMAQASSTYERREASKRAVEKYCPKKLKTQLDQNTSVEVKDQLYKELESVDLRDVSFNTLKNFMCKYCYVEDIHWMAVVDLDNDKEALLVQRCCIYIVEKIAYPFVVFNDFYFFPGWEHEFKKVGKVFLIMNTICGELLEAIKH